MSLAILSTASGGSLRLPVVATNFGLRSNIEEAQVKQSTVYYPIKVLQDDFKFTVQFSRIRDYQEAQTFIYQATKRLMAADLAGEAVLSGYFRFNWPEMGIDYQGFIKNSPMGGKKFDYSPIVEYTMILVRDSIYSPTYRSTQVPGFESIAGQDLMNTGAAVRNADPILNPPIQPTAPPPGG
jgi:hypothetical protein